METLQISSQCAYKLRGIFKCKGVDSCGRKLYGMKICEIS